jgi:hypothetical protein
LSFARITLIKNRNSLCTVKSDSKKDQNGWILYKISSYNLTKNAIPKSVNFLMVEFGRTENLLDVRMQYEIFGFCRLGLNQRKFCWTKAWNITLKNQISGGCRLRWSKLWELLWYEMAITWKLGSSKPVIIYYYHRLHKIEVIIIRGCQAMFAQRKLNWIKKGRDEALPYPHFQGAYRVRICFIIQYNLAKSSTLTTWNHCNRLKLLRL